MCILFRQLMFYFSDCILDSLYMASISFPSNIYLFIFTCETRTHEVMLRLPLPVELLEDQLYCQLVHLGMKSVSCHGIFV